MTSMLRASLASLDESEGGDVDACITMKGPLGDAFTQALNLLYAKNKEGGEKVSTESQANDALALQNLAAQFVENAEREGPEQTIYGVSAQAVNEQDVVNVTQALAGKESNENPAGENDPDFFLVFDGTQPGDNSPNARVPSERWEDFKTALECIVEVYGGKVYPSLEAFALDRCVK